MIQASSRDIVILSGDEVPDRGTRTSKVALGDSTFGLALLLDGISLDASDEGCNV